jgi:hydroxypyruvate reductase
MIIQNYRELAQSRAKKNALKILESGLGAASPTDSLKKYLKNDKIEVDKKSINLSDYSAVYLVSFGKASDSMARVANSIIDIKSGFIVIPKGSNSVIKSKKFQIFNSGHPTPDQTSVNAAKTILKFLEKRKKSEFVLFLVSGGGSSLLCLPDGIPLDDKMYVNNLLLKSGAAIQEFNCVRKHLSKIKGGRLVENLPCDAASLIMSDVDDDDLSSISSGVTYCDTTTFADALSVIKKYNLQKKFPENVLDRLNDGKSGNIPETPKKPKIPHSIILSNKNCLEAMVQKAEQIGYNTKIISVSGNIKDATQKIIKLIPQKEKTCLIFGGEPTVKVIGQGKGGRSQELVLRLLKNTQNTKEKLVIASLGTDGIDGNTKYAGAITDNFQIDSDKIKSYLRNNDSSSFFQKYGGLIITGFTHTNLQDIGLILLD